MREKPAETLTGGEGTTESTTTAIHPERAESHVKDEYSQLGQVSSSILRFMQKQPERAEGVDIIEIAKGLEADAESIE